MARRAWPFRNNGNTTLPVAIVETGNKHLAVAVIVGDYATDTICEHGQAYIDQLANAAAIHELIGRLHKVEIATEAGATARVEMAIACADDGDTIVFMCADSAIFDSVWLALNVRNWP